MPSCDLLLAYAVSRPDMEWLKHIRLVAGEFRLAEKPLWPEGEWVLPIFRGVVHCPLDDGNLRLEKNEHREQSASARRGLSRDERAAYAFGKPLAGDAGAALRNDSWQPAPDGWVAPHRLVETGQHIRKPRRVGDGREHDLGFTRERRSDLGRGACKRIRPHAEKVCDAGQQRGSSF